MYELQLLEHSWVLIRDGTLYNDLYVYVIMNPLKSEPKSIGSILYFHYLTALHQTEHLWAVVGAFLHFSITRLNHTWDEVPKAKKEVRLYLSKY